VREGIGLLLFLVGTLTVTISLIVLAAHFSWLAAIALLGILLAFIGHRLFND
jgi:hypothetical protein